MRSHREPPPKPPDAPAAECSFDARFLADARLLAALHVDLGERLGAAGAAAAMLRAGFSQGLRDAIRARGALRPAAPLLAMRFEPDSPTGALHGSWPERVEAEALRIAGAGRDGACSLSAGYTSGWLSGLWEADVLAVERRCAAAHHGACSFEAREIEGWRSARERGVQDFLAALPFEALREEAEREIGQAEPAEEAGAFDPRSPAVHVWGPVMVVPYAGAETAVAVQAVTREPAAASVTVVVVDLEGACVEEGFGAAALERAIDAIESLGAEAVIAGVSPLAARIVARLGRGELVVREDLRAAIATAFQIAESQRHAT
jgi:anti-anti-sigma regulatory factor